MRKIIIVFLLLILIVTTAGLKREEKINEPYLSAIEFLRERNVLHGYPDGTYRVDWAITQGEFVTLLVRGYNITQSYSKREEETFIFKLKRFFISIFSIFKKKEKFIILKEHWVHPYLLELSKLEEIRENEVDLDAFISLEEALFLEISLFPFKDEIKDINLSDAKDNREKILSCSVSHGLFPENIRFGKRLSRGDAFLLIKRFIEKREYK